jgi:hypothetical protein
VTEAARLASIRSQVAAIAPGQWSRVYAAEGRFVEAQGAMGELTEIARFHPGATEDEVGFVVEAPDNVRFLLGLVDRAIATLRQAQGEVRGGAPAPHGELVVEPRGAGRAKDYAAEAAMKCQEPAFKKFLEERHGLERPLTDERTAQKLRSLLGVTTRAALNSDAVAAARWKTVRGEFEAWRRAS